MRRRIRCLWHKESTASLVQRKDGWYCYGVCNKLYSNKDVEERTGEHYEYEEQEDEKEDLSETLRYIHSLPLQRVRGLRLPVDERGYYLVWPGDVYYKLRSIKSGKGPKYIGPRGHKPPLFWASKSRFPTLAVVEGEINALSLAEAFPEWDVCSPGSATMFNADNLSKYLTEFKQYSKVIVILDADAAGTKGLIEAKAFLLYKIPFLDFIQINPDVNELLDDGGTEKVRGVLQGASRR